VDTVVESVVVFVSVRPHAVATAIATTHAAVTWSELRI
jgi:hypothetical protein